MKKVVLAYSGGLDTSYCTRHLSYDLNMEVHAVVANNGGFSAGEINEMKVRAYELGATSFKELDITDDYYNKCLRFLLYGNIKRLNTYPLSVSSERIFQALAIAKYAVELRVDAIAHGSTGAGNDQVRFDIVFKTLAPQIEIITPIRDNKLSRAFEIEYLAKAGVDWTDSKPEYSINQGIWGTSVGGKETLTSSQGLPEDAFPFQVKEAEIRNIKITFEKGNPVAINDKRYDKPLSMIKDLEVIGNDYGIGRGLHVGDTIIGIKGRVGFQAAAALMLIESHTVLEKHVLTKHQIQWKKQLSDWYGMMLHEAQYLEPTMRWIENLLINSQENVSGEAFLRLEPYLFTVEEIKSPYDLMNTGAGTYGEENHLWTADDAKGFINMLSVPHRIYYSIHQDKLPK